MSAEPQRTSTAVDGTLYLVRFLQVHESFRRPELDALARVTGVKYEIVDYRDSVSVIFPYMSFLPRFAY